MSSPHFIIAGERRSGSTTLYEILKQHSEVGMFHQSDYDFFIEPELFSRSPPEAHKIKSWNETHPISRYKDLFSHLNGKIGQKDADLLWWRPSHERLARLLPDTRFIFILRNPVKRAESQYYNELGKGRENLSFKEALAREEKKTLTDWQKLHLQYKERGCYAKSLEHFYKFIPKHRVKVIILEELFNNWKDVMTEICDFLEINVTEGMAIKPLHSNKEELLERKDFSKKKLLSWGFDLWDRLSEAVIVRISKKTTSRIRLRKILRGCYYTSKRTQQSLDSAIFEELTNYYKSFNTDLENLLGKKISYW
jgi:Sulfotransferase family